MSGEARLDDMLTRIASGSAVGGGAAAALAGAATAALAAMVARVAARHAPVADAARLAAVADEADRLRAQLAGLAEADAEASRAVVAGQRRPEAERREAVQRALVRATEVPVETARAAARLLEMVSALMPEARPSTVPDVAVAAALGWAALESAAVIARSNLAELEDAAFRAAVGDELDGLLRRGAALRAQVATAGAAGS